VDLLTDDVQKKVQIDPQLSSIIDNLGFDQAEFDFVIYISEQLLDQITVLQITGLDGKQVSLTALIIPKQLPESNIIFMFEELQHSLVIFDGLLSWLAIYLDLEFDDKLYNLDEITVEENRAYDELTQLLFQNNIFPDQANINLVRNLQNEIEISSEQTNFSVLRIFGIIFPVLFVLYLSIIFVELNELSKNKDKLSLLEIRGAIFKQRLLYQFRSMKKMFGIACIISIILPTIVGLALKFPTSYLIINPILLFTIDIFLFFTLFIVDYTYLKQLESPDIRISLPRNTIGKIFVILGLIVGIISLLLHLFNNLIPSELSVLKLKDSDLVFLNMYAMFFVGIALLVIKIPILNKLTKDKEYLSIFLKFIKGFNHYLLTLPLLLLFITPILIGIDASSSIRLISDERRAQAAIGDLEIRDYSLTDLDKLIEIIDNYNKSVDSYGISLFNRRGVFIYDSNVPNDIDMNIAIIINPQYWVDNTKFYDNHFLTDEPEILLELDKKNTTIAGYSLGYNLDDDYQFTIPVEDNNTTRLETFEGKVIASYYYAIPGVRDESTMIFGINTIDYHKLGELEMIAYVNFKDTATEDERQEFTNLLKQNEFHINFGRFSLDNEYNLLLQENIRITKITNIIFPIFVIILSLILISMDNIDLERTVKLLNEKGWTKKEMRNNFLIFSSVFFLIDLFLLSFASIAGVYANLYTNMHSPYYPMPSAPEIFFSQYFWIVLIITTIIHAVYGYKLKINLRRLK
jgi:hypothetical protein